MVLDGRVSPAALGSPNTKMGYRRPLDGLRSLAIGLVLAEHTGLEIFDGGNSGVIVFFVLSGFLISKLMLEEWSSTDTLDVKAFYGRRMVRIMPAPLVLVAVTFAFSWHLVPDSADRRYLWFELFMAATYIYSLRPLLFGSGGPFGVERPEINYMAHTWSLAVEEHFYLVWPWLLKWLRLPRRDPSMVIKALVGFVVVVTALRVFFDQFSDPDVVSISFLTFDGFALGAALAFAVHAGLATRLRAVLRLDVVAGLALLVLFGDLTLRDQDYASAPTDYEYSYITYCALAAVVLIGHLYDNQDGIVARFFSLGPLVLIGKLSYSLYLWHVPIQIYFSQTRFPSWSLWQIVVVEQVATLVAAFGSYRLIELQAARLRKHFVVDTSAVKHAQAGSNVTS